MEGMPTKVIDDDDNFLNWVRHIDFVEKPHGEPTRGTLSFYTKKYKRKEALEAIRARRLLK